MFIPSKPYCFIASFFFKTRQVVQFRICHLDTEMGSIVVSVKLVETRKVWSSYFYFRGLLHP